MVIPNVNRTMLSLLEDLKLAVHRIPFLLGIDFAASPSGTAVQ